MKEVMVRLDALEEEVKVLRQWKHDTATVLPRLLNMEADLKELRKDIHDHDQRQSAAMGDLKESLTRYFSAPCKDVVSHKTESILHNPGKMTAIIAGLLTVAGLLGAGLKWMIEVLSRK